MGLIIILGGEPDFGTHQQYDIRYMSLLPTNIFSWGDMSAGPMMSPWRPHHLEDLRASFDERAFGGFFTVKGKRGWREYADMKWWFWDILLKSWYWRGFVEIVFLWYHFGQDLMIYVYSQRTLSHFFYASSCGCMRWNKFDATLLPDEVFQNTSMHCDQCKWFLRIQLRLGLKSMSTYVLHMSFRHPTWRCFLYVYMYVVFVWICVNQGFRFSMIVVTLDRAVSLSVS